MDSVRVLFLLMAATCVLLLMAGLFRPWIVLWWEITQNRRKVLGIYGSVAGACLLIYWVLSLVEASLH